MKTCPCQSVPGRTLLYKLVICDLVLSLICSLLSPEFRGWRRHLRNQLVGRLFSLTRQERDDPLANSP